MRACCRCFNSFFTQVAEIVAEILNPFFLKTGFAIKEFCLNEPKREREREREREKKKEKRDSPELEIDMGRGRRAVGELGFV
jgi:hypothetical protein